MGTIEDHNRRLLVRMAVDKLVYPYQGDGEEIRIYTELLKVSVFGISGYLVELHPEARHQCQTLIGGLEQLLGELQAFVNS